MLDKIWKNETWAQAVVLGVALLSFINIFPNQFITDDFDFIVHWPLIRNIANLPRFFIGYVTPETQEGIYSPLRTVIFSMMYHFSGGHPFGFHLFSIAIHMIGVWGVYRLMRLLADNATVAFWGALMFAVHPVHVESITAMTAAVDTVGIVLLLWSFYYYVRMFGESAAVALKQMPELREGGLVRRYYGLSLGCAALAMFTHELALSVPVLLFFYDAFFSPQRFQWGRAVKRLLPFVAIFGVYVLLKWAVLGQLSRGQYPFGAAYQTGLVVLKSWGTYLWVLIFPVVLTHNRMISPGIFSFDQADFDRALFLSQSIWDAQALLSVLVIMALIVGAVMLYRRGKPLAAFCVGWFFLSLLPSAQIIPSSVLYAERYLYGASFAFCLLMASGYVAGTAYGKSKSRWAAYCLCAVMWCWIGFSFVRTLVRNSDYRNDIVYHEKAVRLSPTSGMLRNALGIIYMDEGLMDEAVEQFEQSVALNPNDPDMYFSMAPAYSALERYDDSYDALIKAIELKPDYAEAYYNLAGMMFFLGDEERGSAYLTRAVDLWRQRAMIIEAGQALMVFDRFLSSRRVMSNPPDAGTFLDVLEHE